MSQARKRSEQLSTLREYILNISAQQKNYIVKIEQIEEDSVSCFDVLYKHIRVIPLLDIRGIRSICHFSTTQAEEIYNTYNTIHSTPTLSMYADLYVDPGVNIKI